MATSDSEEDDYMSMAIPTETTNTKPMTSLQKTQQKRAEALLRSRPLPKAEREAAERKAREAALSTSLNSSNKGAKLLAKMGFKGGALGKSEGARTEPIEVDMKVDRGGIGMDSEKKKRIREDMEQRLGAEKRQKAEEGEYRERKRKEEEEKRVEGCVWAAMKVVERLDTEAEEDKKEEDKDKGEDEGSSEAALKKVNVLWRTLARQRVERERDKKARQQYRDFLSTALPTIKDREEDADDRIALGTEVEDLEEPEDIELEEFTALEPSTKLQKLVDYLRTTYNYCFWCKYRYPDSSLEGCPGVTEEDHD